MFGYVRPDDPYIYKKDEVLYNGVYCGLCRSVGKLCGQTARLGLAYDVAFLSVLLHNLADADVRLEKRHCVVHWFRKKTMAAVDNISLAMAALNVVMCYYKSCDDIADEGRGGMRKLTFRKGYNRARKKFPEIAALAERCYGALAECEEQKVASSDVAADPFAAMTRDVCMGFVPRDEAAESAFYFLGKWIYLIDALDDYDKDIKKESYNVFFEEYGSKDGESLILEHGAEIAEEFNAVMYRLAESADGMKYRFNNDLISNVLKRGIPKQTRKVFGKYIKQEVKDVNRSEQ